MRMISIRFLLTPRPGVRTPLARITCLLALLLCLAVTTTALAQDDEATEEGTGWFRTDRISVGIACLLFGAMVVGFVIAAQRGRDFYIRRIAGLEAVEDAVGRATEMGRPILFSPGLSPMDEVSTVAAMNILGQVARRVAPSAGSSKPTLVLLPTSK